MSQRTAFSVSLSGPFDVIADMQDAINVVIASHGRMSGSPPTPDPAGDSFVVESMAIAEAALGGAQDHMLTMVSASGTCREWATSTVAMVAVLELEAFADIPATDAAIATLAATMQSRLIPLFLRGVTSAPAIIGGRRVDVWICLFTDGSPRVV